MSDEYTPTTEQVRATYLGGTLIEFREEGFGRFQRWLAEVERAAAEKAWWEACLRIADGESNLDIADTYQKQNPYLEAIPNE